MIKQTQEPKYQNKKQIQSNNNINTNKDQKQKIIIQDYDRSFINNLDTLDIVDNFNENNTIADHQANPPL